MTDKSDDWAREYSRDLWSIRTATDHWFENIDLPKLNKYGKFNYDGRPENMPKQLKIFGSREGQTLICYYCYLIQIKSTLKVTNAEYLIS